MESLSVHDLCFSYDTRPILRDISFSVEPGMICGLIGPNASGKTTLFKCINGILKPIDGQIRVDGRAVGGLSRKDIAHIMAVVPQHSPAAFSFSVLQMVVMGRASRFGSFGSPSRKEYQAAENALDELGISNLKHRTFNTLSGGEKQIVLIARALFQEPSILLLDEPTAHLDFKNQYLVMEMVRAVTRRKNLTTVVTLHDPNLAAQYCNSVVMLKSGVVHQKGTIEDIFQESVLESVYEMKVSVTQGCSGKCFIMPAGWMDAEAPSRGTSKVLRYDRRQ